CVAFLKRFLERFLVCMVLETNLDPSTRRFVLSQLPSFLSTPRRSFREESGCNAADRSAGMCAPWRAKTISL
ncbi:MAG TPA: hypothetical protein VFQ30_09910, partial [Ktedonobacteraceae bacterium]|nr:hypothetical protein [Ktedonobacteraceae bacterium]